MPLSGIRAVSRCFALLVTLLALPSTSSNADEGSASRPLAPDYQVNDDRSVTLRICFNWSCAARERVTFTASEMAGVARLMAQCPRGTPEDRLQRLRIGVWQMESLAQSRQPLLANDEPVNDRDGDREGRMDCIDNTSNTTTYLSVLRDLDLLPGWSIADPEVRDPLSMAVHWTAVVVDTQTRRPWAVDSWFRGNGHLPFVMPLDAWEDGGVAWQPPFDVHNPTPQYSHEFCASASVVQAGSSAAPERPQAGRVNPGFIGAFHRSRGLFAPPGSSLPAHRNRAASRQDEENRNQDS